MHSASETSTMAAAEAGQAIWNPVAVVGWSLVFTPAFGSYLLMRNWETLGDLRQAALARAWFCFSLGLLAVQILSTAINRRLNSDSGLMAWLGLLNLAAWCVIAALPQVRVLRKAVGYRRKAWDLALLYGALGGVACFLAEAGLSYVLLIAT